MAVVTVSREIGAGGDEVSVMVAEKLGYELVDKALIVQVARRAGVSVESAAELDGKYQPRMIEWLKGIIEPRVGKILTEEAHLNPETYVEYAKTVINSLAEKGNVVIVGRGAQFILGENDSAFHVRIIADKEYRISRLMKARRISEHDATELIQKSDSMRTRYIDRYLNDNWSDPTAYHLTIDVSRLGIELSALIIAEAVDGFSRMTEYVPGIRDRRKARERREAERRRSDRRDTEVGITQKEITHVLIQEGRPPRQHSIPDRRQDERRVDPRREDSAKV